MASRTLVFTDNQEMTLNAITDVEADTNVLSIKCEIGTLVVYREQLKYMIIRD